MVTTYSNIFKFTLYSPLFSLLLISASLAFPSSPSNAFVQNAEVKPKELTKYRIFTLVDCLAEEKEGEFISLWDRFS